ncbi:MAG: hypothetical protein JWP34_3171 [Massilia sp.]|nr:hypothetical protein [Massilia sp.]
MSNADLGSVSDWPLSAKTVAMKLKAAKMKSYTQSCIVTCHP